MCVRRYCTVPTCVVSTLRCLSFTVQYNTVQYSGRYVLLPHVPESCTCYCTVCILYTADGTVQYTTAQDNLFLFSRTTLLNHPRGLARPEARCPNWAFSKHRTIGSKPPRRPNWPEASPPPQLARGLACPKPRCPSIQFRRRLAHRHQLRAPRYHIIIRHAHGLDGDGGFRLATFFSTCGACGT